jgi:hypothetical protein
VTSANQRARPHEVAAHVHAVGDRAVRRAEVAVEVGDAVGTGDAPARARSSEPLVRAGSRTPFGLSEPAARRRLACCAERHGPGGSSGLQNRQAVVARRLEGSIPSPLRFRESLLSPPFRAGGSRASARRRRPLERAQNCPALPKTSPHSSPHPRDGELSLLPQRTVWAWRTAAGPGRPGGMSPRLCSTPTDSIFHCCTEDAVFAAAWLRAAKVFGDDCFSSVH